MLPLHLDTAIGVFLFSLVRRSSELTYRFCNLQGLCRTLVEQVVFRPIETRGYVSPNLVNSIRKEVVFWRFREQKKKS